MDLRQLAYNEIDILHGGRLVFLLNPTIAYLLLVAATFFVLVAIIAPGTGPPEVIAIFSLVLAGYAIYHFTINWWAVALLFLSLVPFFFAVGGVNRAALRREIWLAISVAGLALGSVYFFHVQNGLISVHPAVAITTSVLYSVIVWFFARKVMQVAMSRPMQDLSVLIGQSGVAKTIIDLDGSVQVEGELWSARSEIPIPAGKPIRIIRQEGFILIVEKDSLRESELKKRSNV